MMKRTLIAAMLCFVAGPAFAEKNSVDPDDPCDVFFCMAGLVYGEKSECQSAINKFYSLKSFKKHHIFDAAKSFKKRNSFLGQCAAADPEHISKIMSKFGRLKG